MLATIVIVGLIGVYCFCIIKKKKKEIQEGRFCSCGCEDCPSRIKCTKKE